MNNEIQSLKMKILDLKKTNEILGYVFFLNLVLAGVGGLCLECKNCPRGLSSGLNWCRVSRGWVSHVADDSG